MLSILGVLLLGLPAGADPWGESPLSTTGRNGISEFYLRYALENTPLLVQTCTRDTTCITGIEDSLAALKTSGLANDTRLQFYTSRELGSHLYRWDEGSVLAINRDLLVIARNGVLNPYSYPDAVSFFMNAWGERMRLEEQKTRMLAYRLNMMVYYKWARLNPDEAFLSQFSFGFIKGPAPALALEDNGGSETAYTLEVPFLSRLSCATSTGMATPMREFKINSAKWEPSSNLTFSHALIQVSGKLAYSCPTMSGEVEFTSDYQVQVDVNFKYGIWSMNTGSLRIQQNGIRAVSH